MHKASPSSLGKEGHSPDEKCGEQGARQVCHLRSPEVFLQERHRKTAPVLRERDMCGNYLQRIHELDQNYYPLTTDVPLLRVNGLPAACSHIEARNFVGIPFHHSLRRPGSRCTTRQSGAINFSHT